MLNCILGVSNVNVFTSSVWLPQYYIKLSLTNLSLIHSVGLPTSLEMDRWQVSQWSFSSHITTFRPFVREGTSCSNACLSLLCESHPPQKTSIRKGKWAMPFKFNFSLLFFPFLFSHFCIHSNALNSVMLVLNLNDYLKGISSSEWSKGISYLHAVRTLG